MAVGLGELPVMHSVAGFELGIASAGIKKPRPPRCCTDALC